MKATTEITQKNRDIPHPTIAVASKPYSVADVPIFISSLKRSKSKFADFKTEICQATSRRLLQPVYVPERLSWRWNVNSHLQAFHVFQGK